MDAWYFCLVSQVKLTLNFILLVPVVLGGGTVSFVIINSPPQTEVRDAGQPISSILLLIIILDIIFVRPYFY